jgi:hypothetical protein
MVECNKVKRKVWYLYTLQSLVYLNNKKISYHNYVLGKKKTMITARKRKPATKIAMKTKTTRKTKINLTMTTATTNNNNKRPMIKTAVLSHL